MALAVSLSSVAFAAPAFAEFCNGRVTEVTVTASGTLGFRHTDMQAQNNQLWVTACDMESDGARCEAWHRTLTAGLLSGKTVTVSADQCTTSSGSPTVQYIKLRE